MVVRKYYVVEVIDLNSSQVIMTLEYNTLYDVKKFLSHMGYNVIVSDGAYELRVSEATVQYSPSEGTIYSSQTQITEDF